MKIIKPSYEILTPITGEELTIPLLMDLTNKIPVIFDDIAEKYYPIMK